MWSGLVKSSVFLDKYVNNYLLIIKTTHSRNPKQFLKDTTIE